MGLFCFIMSTKVWTKNKTFLIEVGNDIHENKDYSISRPVDLCKLIRCERPRVCRNGRCVNPDVSCKFTVCEPPRVCKRGQCVDQDRCACKAMEDPVCGVDGINYCNPCARRLKVKVACKGKCPCSSNVSIKNCYRC